MNIEMDENGNLTIDGKRVERKEPLSYFSKNASIMHGRFATYDIDRRPDREIEANVLADEQKGVEDNIDPAFKVDIDERLQFDRH